MSVTKVKRLVGRSEVAAYCGMTERWILRAVAEGRIPNVKIGRLVRFDLDAIDAWIDTLARGGDAK